MQNPLAGDWTAFLTDPKYSLIRHAIIAGLAFFATSILQSLTQTDFGGYTPVIAMVAGAAIRWLSTLTS